MRIKWVLLGMRDNCQGLPLLFRPVYPKRSQQGPHPISGGERRRAAILRLGSCRGVLITGLGPVPRVKCPAPGAHAACCHAVAAVAAIAAAVAACRAFGERAPAECRQPDEL